MKLLFVQPFLKMNVHFMGKVYMSQLTLPLLAGLTPSEIDMRIIDENVEPLDFDTPADLVCITTITPSADRAYEIADRFREKGIPVVLGGVHVTHLPEEAAEHADAVVIGEAEPIWQALLEDAQNGGLKPVYQANEKPTLEGLPIPRHDLVKQDGYVKIHKAETSRGCPFNCTFCSTTSMFGNRMRYRPVQEVIEEIKSLKTSFVFFTDNNIIGNPRYAKEFFRALIPLKIRWISQGSLNLARDLELLRLAAKSGCVGMLVGIESLAHDAIQAMGKKVNRVSEYAKEIRMIHKHGIGLIGCFVFGFDQDDPSVFKRTLDFIKKVNIEVPQLTILTPYPGTVLRAELEQQDRVIHSHWYQYDVCHVVFRPKMLSPEQLQAGYAKACREVYSYWGIFKRSVRSVPYLRSLYKYVVFWQVNLVYRKLFLVSLEY